MTQIEEIEKLYQEILTTSGNERYILWGKLDKLSDELLWEIYRDGSPKGRESSLALGNLVHNAVSGWATARGFQKALLEGKPFKRGNTEILYTDEEMQEVIDRNDKTAVENYDSIIEILKEY
jgi:hypothetical protein